MAKDKKKAAPAEGAATEGAPAATTEKTEAPKQPSANGVTRPKSGTATGRVWEISDAISAEKKEPATRAEVMKAGQAENLNSATIATQYGRWRKFHGLGKATPAAATASTDGAQTETTEDDE